MVWINTDAYRERRKKHLDPGSFIYHALKRLAIPPEDDDLFRRFVEKKADAIDDLWTEFLQEEAVERLVIVNPDMSTRLNRTTLSNRVVNALRAADFEKVGDIVYLTPLELFMVKGIGKKGLSEIIGYLHEHGFEMNAE